MQRKVSIVLLAVVFISVMGTQAVLGKDKEDTAIDTVEIMDKFDAVLANQAELLKQIAEIKQELAIIKIRASR